MLPQHQRCLWRTRYLERRDRSISTCQKLTPTHTSTVLIPNNLEVDRIYEKLWNTWPDTRFVINPGKHRENHLLNIAFLNVKKAFDSVPHKLIWYELWKYLVVDRHVRWIDLLYGNLKSEVESVVGGVNRVCYQSSLFLSWTHTVIMKMCFPDVSQEIVSSLPKTEFLGANCKGQRAKRYHCQCQQLAYKWAI